MLVALLVLVCASAGPEESVEDPEELASTLITADTMLERAKAASQLAPLSGAVVADAVLDVVAWSRNSEPPFVGGEGEGFFAMMPLSEPDRLRLATELVTWRIDLTLVGGQEIPERLAAELRGVFAGELERYGEPSQTMDWLYLLAAAGGDPAVVLERLGLSTNHRWNVVVDETRWLHSEHMRDLLPLLAHRSPIVRHRAAERMEEDPTGSLLALSRAWRFAPGRAAPLRGEVGAPALPRTVPGAERWARRLTKWARRLSHQRDDSALRAALGILATPATTGVLTDTARLKTADKLLKTARRDPSPQRNQLIGQGIDAVLRGVPFEEGLAPAPDQMPVGAQSWVRVHGKR
jgi:hypothetical protein